MVGGFWLSTTRNLNILSLGRTARFAQVARAMPHDGAIIFSDLIGKLDVLRVACAKCERAGRYRLDHLIESRGRDAKIVDWLDEITADCPKKSAPNWSDQCAARCPNLVAVL
jgi:hypothetical protein